MGKETSEYDAEMHTDKEKTMKIEDKSSEDDDLESQKGSVMHEEKVQSKKGSR